MPQKNKSDSVPPTCPRCHVKNTQKWLFFCIIEREHHCRKRKVLGVVALKGISKPAKVAKGGKKNFRKSSSSPLIHGIGAVFTANTVRSSCWRGKNLPLLTAALRMLKERVVSTCFLGIFYGEDPLTPPTQTQKLLPDIRCPNWEDSDPQLNTPRLRG